MKLSKRIAIRRRGARRFDPSTMSGITHEWAFNEGSGNGSVNKRATSPTSSFPNLCGSPEQLFGVAVGLSGWEDMFGGATITDEFAANPNNAELTATRLQLTATGSKGIRYIPGGNLLSSGVQYTASCWVKSNSGATETVRLFYGNGPTFSTDRTVTVAESWKRITFTFTTSATGLYVGIGSGSAAGAVNVLIWGFTLHLGAADLGHTNSVGDALFGGGTSAPTWGAGRLTFDGTNDVCPIPLGRALSLPEVSVYFVFRQHSTLTNNQAWYGSLLSTPGQSFGSQTLCLGAGGLSNNASLRKGPSFSYGQISIGFDPTSHASEGVLTGTDHVIAATHDGATLRMYIDGHLLAEKASVKADQTVSRLVLGFVQGAAGYFKGDYLYGVVCNAAHSRSYVQDTACPGLLSLCSSRPGYIAPPTNTIVMFLGDSLTAGVGTAVGDTWVRLTVDSVLGPLGIQAINCGVPGDHIAQAAARVASIEAMIGRSSVTKKVAVILLGTNDQQDTAVATAIQQHKDLCTDLKSRGYKIVVCTLDRKRLDAQQATVDAFTVTFNDYLQNAANLGVYFDQVADNTADTRIGETAVVTDATYLIQDGGGVAVHFTDAANAVKASFVQPKLQAALTALGF